MSDPSRLLETSADELERVLLRAGSSYEASSQLREKTLAALGVGGATAALSSGASAGAGIKVSVGSALAKLGSAKLVLLVVGVGAALALPVVVLGLRGVAAVSAPLESKASKPVTSRPAGLAPVAPSAAPRRLAAPGSEDAPPVLQAPRAPSSAKPLSSAEALRVELAQLDAARSKLKAGHSEEALGLLDAYERSAPRGMLKLEAEVLRIDALSRSGRTELAKSRAQAFLARHPTSVLAARVRRLAGQ